MKRIVSITICFLLVIFMAFPASAATAKPNYKNYVDTVLAKVSKPVGYDYRVVTYATYTTPINESTG